MRDGGVFISWVHAHGRSHDLAQALDLAECNYPRSILRLPPWLRYLLATVWTIGLLVRRRPAAVVVMSPPPFPAFLAALYCLISRRPLVVDAHSGAFNKPAWRRLSRSSLRLAQRCRHSAVIVTNGEMRAEAESWLRMPVIELHDLLLPMDLPPAPSATCDAFVVSSWMADEPIETLAAAMPSLSDLRVVISGRPPSEQLRKAVESAGIVVPGFLSDAEYRTTLAGAGVVVALTTRDGTMQRGGYEAASAGKALVTSDTRVLRDYFGTAASYAANDAESIAAAIKDGLARRAELEAEIRALRDRRLAAQDAGLRQLANVLQREVSTPAA